MEWQMCHTNTGSSSLQPQPNPVEVTSSVIVQKATARAEEAQLHGWWGHDLAWRNAW